MIRRRCAQRVAIDASLLIAVLVGHPQQTTGTYVAFGVGYTGDAPLRAALIGTTHVGQAPTILAVDDRHGHVFVLSAGPAPTSSAAPSASRQPLSSVSMLDVTTGRVLRTTPIDPSPQAMAVDERTGRVFVACDGAPVAGGSASVVDVLDAGSDRLMTTIPAGGADFRPQSLAVDEQTGHVYLSSLERIYVLDATTGRLTDIRDVAGHGVIVVAPRVHRAFVFGNGSFTVLDTATLAVRQTSNTGGLPGNDVVASVDARANRVYSLYGNIHAGNVTALDAHTGAGLYEVQTDSQGGPAIILAVDERRGHVFVDTDNAGTQDTPVVGIGIYDGATGKRLAVAPLGAQDAFPNIRPGGSQYLAIDEPAARAVLVTTQPPTGNSGTSALIGSLVVFDAQTGHYRTRVRVGRDPQAVAVDTKRGRVFVANRGDNTVSVFDATKL